MVQANKPATSEVNENSGEKKSFSKFNYSLLLLVVVLMLFARKDVTFREGKLKAYLNVETLKMMSHAFEGTM